MVNRWQWWLAIGCLGLLTSFSPANAAVRTHYYDLKTSLADDFSGPALAALGGTVAFDGYHFFPGKGLVAHGAMNPQHYTVVMVFALETTVNYRKLLDFRNLSTDYGLYNYGGYPHFYPVTQGTNALLASNTFFHLTLTRDNSNAKVVCFINGTAQFSFSDTNQYAVFTNASNAAYFFMDDTTTGGAESAGGILKTLEIFDGPLSESEVATLVQARPPVLAVRQEAGALNVRWSNLVYGFRLESTTNRLPTDAWLPVTNPPSMAGFIQSIAITNREHPGHEFFRLRKP